MNINILIMTNSYTVEITTFSLVHGWFYSVKLMYSILHKAKKRKYILFILMRIKCILEQSETIKYTQSNPAV